MNIKLVETLTGMNRSNIRFYENEGFINPKRLDNGYREYSDEDVEILKRIKLLRSLHISLDDIKNLHNGTNDLLETLNQHIQSLEKEINELNQSSHVCKKIMDDQVTYSTLHADEYFSLINENQVNKEMNQDIIKQPIIPWRRYFARTLDLSLYSLLWYIILAFVFRVPLVNRNILENLFDSYMAIAFMFLFEPIFLSKFATTPGKWCMGIYIYDYSNQKLTWMESFNRTLQLFIKGMGFSLPRYTLYREYKAFKSNTANEILEWDINTTIKAKEKYILGIIIYIFVTIIHIILLVMIETISLAPNHKGDLTIQQFSENYNYIAKYKYADDLGCFLDKDANWVHNGNVIHMSPLEHPEIKFELENGVIKKLTLEQAIYSNTEPIMNYPNTLLFILEAMITSQDGYNPLSNDLSNIQTDFIEHIKTEYKKDYHNLTIFYHLDYKGHEFWRYDLCIPDEEDPQNYFKYTFEIVVK